MRIRHWPPLGVGCMWSLANRIGVLPHGIRVHAEDRFTYRWFVGTGICGLGSIEIGSLDLLNTLPFDYKLGSPEPQLGLLPDINKPPLWQYAVILQRVASILTCRGSTQLRPTRQVPPRDHACA